MTYLALAIGFFLGAFLNELTHRKDDNDDEIIY